jgi:hypothetical protein
MEPMIYTTKGNLPVAGLEYLTSWQETEDYVKFVEIYKLNGEVVRESAHVLSRHGVDSEAVASSIN